MLDHLTRYLRWLYVSVFSNIFVFLSRKKINELRRTLKDENFLILGNGPSLPARLDLTASGPRPIIVCNHFYRTAVAKAVRPDFYCASDPRLFFPVDFEWLKNVKETNPDYLVVPGKFFYLKFLYRGKILFYRVREDAYLWEEGVEPELDIENPLPNGDTVVCDISIPLASSLGARKLTFAGLNFLHPQSGPSHAYSEDGVRSKRRSNDYLATIWPAKAQISFKKQILALFRQNIEIISLSNGQVAEDLMLNADKIISENEHHN